MSSQLQMVQGRHRSIALATGPEEAFFLGEKLLKSGMLPDHIRTPEQAMFIILAGAEIGMPATRALRSLQIVKGKIVEGADSQLARFKEAGGRGEFADLSETRAELHLTHPNGDKHSEVYAIEDAKRAGLTANQTWQKHPKAMLRSRAITAGLKSIGWIDAVGAYDPDEAREFSGSGESAATPSAEVVEQQKIRPNRKSLKPPVADKVPESPPAMAAETSALTETDDRIRVVTGVFRRQTGDGYVIELDSAEKFPTADIEVAKIAKRAMLDGRGVRITLDGAGIFGITCE